MKLSFRNRIALFTAMAAAITIGLVFVVVYGVVHITAYKHLDDDIRREKEEVMINLRWAGDSMLIEDLPEWEEKEHLRIEVNPTFLQIVDAGGRLLFRSSNLQQDKLLFDPHYSRETFFDSHIGARRIRQGQFPILNKHQTVIGHLSVGISQEESAIVLHNLRNTLWLAFPLVLLALFLAAGFAASRSIAPVQQLIQAAAGIRETNIDSRLPLPENKDEIYQLATTINELLQRVENGIIREKQFTADASHEMRTPLTAIRGTLEVLLRKHREPAQYEEKIRRVIEDVDRLHGLLEQLLQLARLESDKITVRRSPVRLAVFGQAIVQKWDARLREKNMELQLQIPPEAILHTDENLLTIIIDNLLGNAIKYGHAGGHIAWIWQPEKAAFIIRDDGPGISPEHLQRIFDRFYRADNSRSSAVRGAGLGLAIAKKLADLLGIRLTVSSTEGEGTDFTLNFP